MCSPYYRTSRKGAYCYFLLTTLTFWTYLLGSGYKDSQNEVKPTLETWFLSFICVHYTQADICRSRRLLFGLCLYHMHPWFHPTAYTRAIRTDDVSYLACWNNLCQMFCTQMKRLVKSRQREPVNTQAIFQPCCAGRQAWGGSGSGTASLTILAFLNRNVF